MFYLLLVGIVIEGILLISWNRLYFGWGLPLFVRRIPVSRDALACFSLAQIEPALDQSRLPDLRFHRLSDHVYGFRETFLIFVGPVYPMIMRGRIEIDRKQRSIVITGLCNWTVVYVVAAILIPAATIKPALVAMFLAGIGLAYAVQRWRFGSVEATVRRLLQTNTVPLIPRPPAGAGPARP
ncbi:hypothetical protein [Xanthomonas floridensis]|uniref:Uncharacterized protein n=1 Tax=Xanthomonas floridensis TaxID=1843580 RepID=A0A1A9M7Z0_9XANT|nr:hypothetical protein [Xanthomonas floridensis]MEA5122640.1 hypothetical protein [Xanthomonas floridensis]MEA5131320.1 hypothetical protein [Xanthomonas floridensis]OAG66169.1 hypothetical protein A7D17_04355 [Xanthomonas floridensis]